MPTAYIKKLAKLNHTTVNKLEKFWSQAKEIAKSEGNGKAWGLITTIFQNKLKKEGYKVKAFSVLASTEDKLKYINQVKECIKQIWSRGTRNQQESYARDWTARYSRIIDDCINAFEEPKVCARMMYIKYHKENPQTRDLNDNKDTDFYTLLKEAKQYFERIEKMKEDLDFDNLNKQVTASTRNNMNKYSYKGEIITANSKEEAIKKIVTASEEQDDFVEETLSYLEDYETKDMGKYKIYQKLNDYIIGFIKYIYKKLGYVDTELLAEDIFKELKYCVEELKDKGQVKSKLSFEDVHYTKSFILKDSKNKSVPSIKEKKKSVPSIKKKNIKKQPNIKVVARNRNHLEELIEESIDKYGNKCDLNFIDVSNIKYFGFLFDGSKFNGDISKWNVSNVTDMSGMFENSEFNGDISKWNVSNVKNMANMFEYSKFKGDISKWNVSNVKDMNGMFFGSKFNGDISKWNVSSVKNMDSMFDGSKFNGDISNWLPMMKKNKIDLERLCLSEKLEKELVKKYKEL